MPIRPEDRGRYPENWKQIREFIRNRAGNRCERCGVKNHAKGARDKTGAWWSEDRIHNLNAHCGGELFGPFPKIIKIVCTVAHLDHTPENCNPENLRFWCQRCHNGYDARHRAERRRRRSPQTSMDI